MKVQLTIQEKLKDLRVERGLTLEELEAEVNISKSTLGSYENDEYKDISHTSLITLAKYYGVSTDYACFPFVTASTFPPYFLIRAESYTVRCQW
ncbi:XRE family transcriptional regulator [Lachnospiraceae bacterium AM25-11LB]|nr:XRE family transcriptional regulator [Lachnospiraceae bacterium AM25-22]RGD07594.1 XRE family transcriptional regulator [Lachnospiraceae bacterium AM25-11LB]RJW10125.1 XRE family transcriptional regulator [Lachnospiraceae bacterium AM25-40]RJW14312.1 XRE family transcriptional regulator [Lachnospiraceae bacterium AM25-39]